MDDATITIDILQSLKNKGYDVTLHDIQINPNRGRNNFSYLVNKYNLFIKVYAPDNSFFKKAIYNHNFFSSLTKVPTIIDYFYKGAKNKYNLLLLELIDRKNLEKAEETSIINSSLAQLLVDFHTTRVTKNYCGDIYPKGKHYSSWEDYLYGWVTGIDNFNNRITDKECGVIKKLLLDFLKHNEPYISNIPMSFLHGDINLSNFLLNEEGTSVEYSLDFDYSIIGDSAWEFASALANWTFSSQHYRNIFEKYKEKTLFSKSESENFINRVRIYGPMKKAVLLLRIVDISELDFEKEFNLVKQELGADQKNY